MIKKLNYINNLFNEDALLVLFCLPLPSNENSPYWHRHSLSNCILKVTAEYRILIGRQYKTSLHYLCIPSILFIKFLDFDLFFWTN